MARSIVLLWSGAAFDNAAVTVTGGASYTFDGVAASFPETIDAAKHTIVPANDGTHTVTVTWNGQTVYSKDVLLGNNQGVVLDVSPTVQQQLSKDATVTSTTTDLADVGAAINTTGKYAGKRVFNTTTGVVLVADGPAADDTWSTCAGAATHTPV
jgi:hypothetical protein